MRALILTPDQSKEARDYLGLQQQQVVVAIKEQFPGITINKGYLSEFEADNRKLPSKALRALRDYYEAEGAPAEIFTLLEAANDPQAGGVVSVVRDAVVMCDRLSHSQKGFIQDRVKELQTKLANALREKAEEGIIDPFDDETDLKRDRALGVLAEVGLLYSLLFAQCLIHAPSDAVLKSPRKAKTISDVLSLHFAESFKQLGEVDNSPDPQSEQTAQDHIAN